MNELNDKLKKNYNNDVLENKISFLLENLYLASNALGVGLFNNKYEIIAEIGSLDMEFVGKNLKYLVAITDNFCLTCAKNIDDYSFNVLKKNNLSVLLSKLNSKFCVLSIYPKEVSIFKNIVDIESKVLNIKKLLDNIS